MEYFALVRLATMYNLQYSYEKSIRAELVIFNGKGKRWLEGNPSEQKLTSSILLYLLSIVNDSSKALLAKFSSKHLLQQLNPGFSWRMHLLDLLFNLLNFEKIALLLASHHSQAFFSRMSIFER